MDQRSAFVSNMNNPNVENALLNVKNNLTLEQTPRKLPFGDKTNKAGESLLRSAIKERLKADNSKPPVNDFFNTVDFKRPEDKNCLCCGHDRITDGEMWGRMLALPQEFHERLFDVLSTPLPDEKPIPFEPIRSPLRAPEPEIALPKEEMYDDLSSIDDGFSSDDDDCLEVPNFEVDFSFEIGEDEKQYLNNSVFGDW